MTPHRSSPSSVWYISVSLAATAFIIAVAAYYTLRRPAVPLADPVMVQRTAFVDSALGGLSVLSAGEVVARSDVSPEIVWLIPPDVPEIEINRASFAWGNGRDGFVIRYSAASGDAMPAYQAHTFALRSAPGWERLYATRAYRFALLEARNATYDVQATYTDAGSRTEVIIKVITR